jgi:hypothetical protein
MKCKSNFSANISRLCQGDKSFKVYSVLTLLAQESSSISKLTIIISEIMHLAGTWYNTALSLPGTVQTDITNWACHRSGSSLGWPRFNTAEFPTGFILEKVAITKFPQITSGFPVKFNPIIFYFHSPTSNRSSYNRTLSRHSNKHPIHVSVHPCIPSFSKRSLPLR